MIPLPDDVQVCLPGRGCVEYVPGEGYALNAVVAIGPRVLDTCFAAVLVGLVLVAAIAVVAAVRRRSSGGGRLDRATRATVAALLVAGGTIAAVPTLAPAAAPVAEVFALASSTCVGVAFLLLAERSPRVARELLITAGSLRLLSLPVAVVQFLAAAPLGPTPSDAVTVLGDLTLVFAGLVLIAIGRGFGAMRWALLLPPFAALLTRIRLQLPFAVDSWIDLLPDVAVAIVGVLVLTSRADGASPARGARRAALQAGGAVAALALTLTVFLGWPMPGVGVRGPGEPAIGPVRVVSASSRISLPLDRYRQSTVDGSRVIDAENQLIRVCAERDRVAVPAADLLPAPTVASNSSLLGLIDAQKAATTGYWIAPMAEVSGGLQDEGSVLVLVRCIRTARARLGDDGHSELVVDDIESTALRRADADSRVRRVETAWSRCMQLRGFAYPNPSAVAWEQGMEFPTPHDTRLASASVACERTVNLPGVRAAVLAAYEQRMIAAHRTRLQTAEASLIAEARLANKLLDRPSL